MMQFASRCRTLPKNLLLQTVLAAAMSSSALGGHLFDVTPAADPGPGFKAFTVSIFDPHFARSVPLVMDLSITGVHQIWQNAAAGALTTTPVNGDSARGDYGNPNWNSLDTHLLVNYRPGGDHVTTSPGFQVVETNENSNPIGLTADFLAPQAPNENFPGSAGMGSLTYDVPPYPGTIAWLNPMPDRADLLHVVLPCSRCAKLSMDLVTSTDDTDFVRDYVIGGDPSLPPVVSDVNSLTIVGDAVNLRPSATNCPESWSELLNPRYTPAVGVPSGAPGANLQPQWNPVTQAFNWDTTGSSPGLYTWQVAATSPAGADQGLITVQVTVPEPLSVVLLGWFLALTGEMWKRGSKC